MSVAGTMLPGSVEQLVYTFVFDPKGLGPDNGFAAALRRLHELERSRGRSGRPCWVWRPARFHPSELLPHVAAYLDAGVDHKGAALAADCGERSFDPASFDRLTAARWRLNRDSLASALVGSQMGEGQHDEGRPRGRQPLELRLHVGGRVRDNAVVGARLEIPFELVSVDLVLFRVGVGFLVFKVRPKASDAATWFDFRHYARFFGGQRSVRVTGGDAPPFVFADVCTRLLDGLAPEGAATGGPWRSNMFMEDQAVLYSSWFVALDATSDDAERHRRDLRYRFREYFNAGQRLHQDASQDAPHRDDVAVYLRDQWFTFGLEGGGFLALDPPDEPFFRENLPQHVSEVYFVAFLLALHQRLALLRLSTEVSEHWLRGSEKERLRSFQRIREQYLAFKARGYYSQVMQRNHHHAVYCRWQESLQVPLLFDEVRDEVREMHAYLADEAQRRIRVQLEEVQLQNVELEQRIELIGFLLGGFVLGVGLVQVLGAHLGAWPWWSVVLLVITLGLASTALLAWIAGLPAIGALRERLGRKQTVGREGGSGDR